MYECVLVELSHIIVVLGSRFKICLKLFISCVLYDFVERYVIVNLVVQ